jgi:hypothetical protein
MAGEWDDSLKMLINDNSQDFVTWLFEGAKATGKLLTPHGSLIFLDSYQD